LANDECLKIFDENLALQVQDQLISFGKQIHAISRRARGASGPAIREAIDLCIRILRSRVEHILTTLGTLPFEYSDDLGTKVYDISLKYFASDLAGLRQGIEDMIRMMHGNHARMTVFKEVTKANEIEIHRLRNGLDKFLINIKTKGETQSFDLEKWASGNHVTLAILFTDVIESVALSQELGGELMEKARQAHFEQARKLLHRYRGWEIKTIGDCFMLAFRNVADALDYAIELFANTGHSKNKIRVGIHIGLVQIKEKDAFGNTVDFSSRIISSFEGAEVRISDRAKEDIDSLRANRHKNLKWKKLEGIEMKGFPGKQVLWALAL
jgi:class 3 adenylate cyclase